MSLGLLFLVLLAALFHAIWNALIKLGDDRLVAMALLSGSSGLIGLCLALFVPLPALAAWPYILATSLVHVGYFWFLVKAYEAGDLAETYPVARGSAPLFTLLASALFLREVPSLAATGGVLLIALGLFVLAFAHRSDQGSGEGPGEGSGEGSGDGSGRDGAPAIRPLFYALATGGFIASYTLLDGLGVRLSGTVAGYTAWAFALHGLPFIALVAVLRRGALLSAVGTNWQRGALGGALSFLAYAIVLFAFSLGAIAPIAALRETSVLFSVLISSVLLKEGFGLRRGIAALLVVGGVLLISL